MDGAWHTRAAESTPAMPMARAALPADVVDLVGDAPAGEVERGTVGAGVGDGAGQGGQGLVPRDAVEAAVAAAAAHRVAEPAEGPQARTRTGDRSDSTSASTVGSKASAVLTSSRRSRVVHRWTPSMVQSWRPATPSAQPSHTPLVSTSQAYFGCLRLTHATLAMSP